MQTTPSKSDAEGDLKSLSLRELQAKLGSSPTGQLTLDSTFQANAGEDSNRRLEVESLSIQAPSY